MKKCFFLTEPNFHENNGEKCVAPEEWLADALRELGWDVVNPFLPWKDTMTMPSNALSEFQFALLRTPWDYSEHPVDFARFLDQMERHYAEHKTCKLVNDPAMVRWNMTKHYLQETAEAGIPTIPTTFWEPFVDEEETSNGVQHRNPQRPSQAVEEAFASFGCKMLVIKPAISAGSMFTYRVTREKLRTTKTENTARFIADKAGNEGVGGGDAAKKESVEADSVPLALGMKRTVRSELQWEETLEHTVDGYESVDTFADLIDLVFASGDGRTMLIQPFISTVPTFGEVSVLLFGGEVSHMVKKVPAGGDFRVQGSFGASEHHIPRDETDENSLWSKVCRLGKQLYTYLEAKKFKRTTSLPERNSECTADAVVLPPLYLRLDVVFDEDYSPIMIEAELIEPYLYFDEISKSYGPRMFAKVLDAHFAPKK